MNPIAKELNNSIQQENNYVFEMLSKMGKELFFPKGILSQSAEAKEKAKKINATIGIAKENGGIMFLESVMSEIPGIPPENSLSYAPSFGIPALRQAWKKEQFEKNASLNGKSTSLPVVTNGITHAISIFADVWADAGDVVVLPDLYWGNYNLIMKLRKGIEFAHFKTFDENGGFNVKGFDECVKAQAKGKDKVIVIMNFPHNPTGYSVTEKEAESMVNTLKEVADSGTNVLAVSDDAYFGLFFEEETCKESVFAKLAGIHERILAVKLDGATKENFVWGLRCGFITYGTKTKSDNPLFYEALEKKTAGCIRGNISNASHLGQSIILKSMQANTYKPQKDEKFSVLKERANKVKEVVSRDKYEDYFKAYPFNSGYFMCIKLLKDVDAEKLRLHLLDNYQVGLISIDSNNLRVAFSSINLDDVEPLFDAVYDGINDFLK
jgi:aspartate/methionine/tyrosine aminotransferase